MSTRRALLAGAAGVVVAGAAPAAHPDAALLTLCAQLEAMQAEWQWRWTLTSDGPALETEADRAWQAYSDDVWPGIGLSDWNRIEPGDLAGELRALRATTPEGLKAKARAIMALDHAATYCDCRNDAAQLWQSIIEDVAGPCWSRVGEEAQP